MRGGTAVAGTVKVIGASANSGRVTALLDFTSAGGRCERIAALPAMVISLFHIGVVDRVEAYIFNIGQLRCSVR